jgi:hypothetical protein
LTISAHAEDVLTLSTFLGASAFAEAGSIVEDALFDSFSQEATADASNTLLTFLDPITPGLTITSASGHDYSTDAANGGTPGTGAVPEPSSLALALSGLAFLAYRRRRSWQTGR